MKKLLSVAFVLVSQQCIAQSDTCCSYKNTIKYQGLIAPEKLVVDNVVRRRESNQRFLQQTINYTVPSYATIPYIGALGEPKTPYILTADIMPHFVFGGPRSPLAIHFTPRFKVRLMTNKGSDSSFPVRTPSYMPGATVYIKLRRFLSEYNTHYYFASVSFFHHSNGQDGDEYKLDTPTNTYKINTYNGNFSTNYIEGAVYYRYRKMREFNTSLSCPCIKQPYTDHVVRLGIEQHFGGADALQPFYGNTRINLNYQFIRVNTFCDVIKRNQVPVDRGYLRERYRLLLANTFIAGKREGSLDDLHRRINSELSLHYRIRGSPNTSFFLGKWL